MCARVLIRSLAICSLVLLALTFEADAFAQQKKDGSSELSGVVTGAGGARVVLHLRSLDGDPVRYYDGYEETAASDGSFHFGQITPGAYQLEASASGFTPSTPLPITLRPGESRRGVSISLTSSSFVCGRVTENGVPKSDTWVNVYRYDPEFAALSQTFLPHLGPNGTFRVQDLTPGMYYLEAYTTFYPGSFSFNGAKPIVVGPETETGTVAQCSLEIPLQYTGCHATKVAGHIAASPDNDGARFKVLFLSRNPAGGTMPAIIAMNSNEIYKPGDSFSATVCPGSYDLVLSDDQLIGPWTESPTHKVVFDSRPIEVGDAAIENLELTPRPMATISGEVPGMSHGVSCPSGGPRAHVSILREGDGEFQSMELDDKNRFVFRNVAPGEYTVYAGPFLREAFYLDSILVDGKPIEGRRFTVAEPRQMNMVINIGGDVSHAPGHLAPDLRRETRWEAGWTRPKGSVSGQVSGDGASGALLKLRSLRYNSNASGEYTAHAGRDGSFLFDKVDPGVYTLRAEGPGILSSEFGAFEAGQRGTPIVVARDAHIEGLTLPLSKLSAICGRVTNRDGSPLAGARIFLQWNHDGSVYGGPPGPSEVLTDADGRFRYEGLNPGEYFPASPLDVNRIVFFSSDGSLRAAAPVTVEAGKDVGCGSSAPLKLSVPSDYKNVFSFSGQVSGDLPPAIGDRFWILLLDMRDSGAMSIVGFSKLDANHRFSFDRVRGGPLLMKLYSAYGPEPMTWSGPYEPVSHLLATQSIEVKESMPEVTITPMHLPSVTGTVHFNHVPDEWKNHFQVVDQKIALIPRVYSAPFSSKLSAEGAFSIGPEDVGDYEVDLGLRAPLFLQSVRLDGREIKDRYIHLSAESSPKLEIEVSSDSGQATVRIVPDPSLPIPEPSTPETCRKEAWPEYEVVLFPEPFFVQPTPGQPPEAQVVHFPRLLRSRRTSDDATMQLLEGVPPGRYRALALQGPGLTSSFFLRGEDYSGLDVKMWNALASLAQPVTVQAGDKLELSLPDKTVEVDRIAAKLGLSVDRGLFRW